MTKVNKKPANAGGATTPEKEAEAVIYIGPTVSQVSLLNHRIYRGGLGSECYKLLSVVPGAKHLFVATSDFSDAQKRLADKTSVESVMFSRVIAAMKEIK